MYRTWITVVVAIAGLGTAMPASGSVLTYGWVDVDYQGFVGGAFRFSSNGGTTWAGSATGAYRLDLSGFRHEPADEDQFTLTADNINGLHYGFCIDLSAGLHDVTDVEIIAFEAAPSLGGSAAKAAYLRELSQLFSDCGADPAAHSVFSDAMALAAWEIVYDSNEMGDDYLTSGAYRAKDGVVTDAVKSQVDQWLDQVYSAGGQQAENVLSLQHANWQGLLVTGLLPSAPPAPDPSPDPPASESPEPATLVQWAGLGLAGLYWLRSRRRQPACA